MLSTAILFLIRVHVRMVINAFTMRMPSEMRGNKDWMWGSRVRIPLFDMIFACLTLIQLYINCDRVERYVTAWTGPQVVLQS